MAKRRGAEAATAELRIEAIGDRGDGVGRLDGRPVFVPCSVPGDRLRVRLEGPRGDGLAARTVALLAAGPGRVAPPCPHFGDCGGCALQHLEDGLYARWKTDRIVQALARRGLAVAEPMPLVRVPAASRRRATFVALRQGDSVRLGFHQRGSRRVVDLRVCPILVPPLAALLRPLRLALRPLLAEGRTAAVLATSTESGVDLLIASGAAPDLAAREALADFAATADLARLSWSGPDRRSEPIALRRPARVAFAGVPVDLPPGPFLQASAAGEAALVAAAAAALVGSERIADLYAGCGAFSFPLAVRGARVHAVEGAGEAAAALAAAAAGAGLSARVTVETRDLARDPLSPTELARFDAVLFDPPRAGARAQAAALARSAVRTVVAVSCHPATFARDARILVDGGFALGRVTPVDQFVWTPHVELVAAFRR